MLAIRLPIDLHLPPQSPFCGPRRACAVNPVRGSTSLSLGDGRSRALTWAPSGIGPDDSGEITWPPSQIPPLRRTAASQARLPRSASPHLSQSSPTVARPRTAHPYSTPTVAPTIAAYPPPPPTTSPRH